MDHDFIKTLIAPCGLDCGKCYAFVDGDIKTLSNRLKTSLGNFDIYAERFAELINGDIFRKYPDFKGCRNERCKIFKDCKVRDCFEKKGVDFCFQCSDFPCDNTGFDEHLQKRSIDINMRMREIGVEKFYEETRDKPRY